ncbi:hypothetical protein BGZ63DRAFT_403618 [Mariannaea sp. PMI_226]|nr:hypothetical protein BGZ63DRAFT_403618 [Mariannaea sp. PMI_226]
MRTTSLLVLAAAAAANAGYVEKNGDYFCDEPNTSYCLGGDIILRCDAYGKGTAGRCTSNLSVYPPLGGTASCYEKPGSHGEAACEKNCVVYYTGAPTTLPAALCQPSYTTTSSSAIETLTTVYTHPVPTTRAHYNTTQPGHPGGHRGHPGHHGNSTLPGHGTATATGYTTKCVTVVYPNPTQTGESKTRTITYTSPLYPPGGEPQTTASRPVPSGSPHHHGNGTAGHGGHNSGHGHKGVSQKGANNQNGNQPSGSETRVPVGPTSTSGPETVTGAATANTVSGMLALAVAAAAYLI